MLNCERGNKFNLFTYFCPLLLYPYKWFYIEKEKPIQTVSIQNLNVTAKAKESHLVQLKCWFTTNHQKLEHSISSVCFLPLEQFPPPFPEIPVNKVYIETLQPWLDKLQSMFSIYHLWVNIMVCIKPLYVDAYGTQNHGITLSSNSEITYIFRQQKTTIYLLHDYILRVLPWCVGVQADRASCYTLVMNQLFPGSLVPFVWLVPSKQ